MPLGALPTCADVSCPLTHLGERFHTPVAAGAKTRRCESPHNVPGADRPTLLGAAAGGLVLLRSAVREAELVAFGVGQLDGAVSDAAEPGRPQRG